MTPLQRYLEPELLRRLSTLNLSARTVAAGVTTGRHRSPVRGSSIEFRQHRFYSPGDEPRRIDWRVLARTDRVYVREYEQETNLRCLVLLDTSGSMTYGKYRENKMLYARRAAAAISYLMLAQTESVGLATFGGTTHYLPPLTGESQLTRILTALDATIGAGPTLLGTAITAAANRLTRRTLVILLSDLFTDVPSLAKGLSRLRHDRHEVVLCRLLHQDEEEFPFRRFSRFQGLEGEGSRLLEPATARTAYLSRFANHRKAIDHATGKLGVPLYDFRTHEDLGDALTRLVFTRPS